MTDFISDITITKMHWKLKVLVVRLWEVKDRFNPNALYAIEMILQDEHGNRIQASICSSMLKQFKSNIKEHDVIGEIISFGQIQTHNVGGSSRKFMNIKLEDVE
ncbi:hypothetical protein P3L10_018284 [Capsicum annuum]